MAILGDSRLDAKHSKVGIVQSDEKSRIQTSEYSVRGVRIQARQVAGAVGGICNCTPLRETYHSAAAARPSFCAFENLL